MSHERVGMGQKLAWVLKIIIINLYYTKKKNIKIKIKKDVN